MASVCIALIQYSSKISTREEEGWAYTEVGLLGMELGDMDRSALTRPDTFLSLCLLGESFKSTETREPTAPFFVRIRSLTVKRLGV
jgi:hypothetical protein